MTLDETLQQVEAIEKVMAELSDNEVTVPDSLFAELERYLTVEDDKISAVGKLAARLQEVVDVCNGDAQALWARAATFTQRRKRLLKFVAFVMAKNDVKKLEGTRYTFTRLDGRPRTVIDDENEFIAAWTRGEMPLGVVDVPEPEPRIVKAEVERILKVGKSLPGARIEIGPPTVRVYQ